MYSKEIESCEHPDPCKSQRAWLQSEAVHDGVCLCTWVFLQSSNVRHLCLQIRMSKMSDTYRYASNSHPKVDIWLSNMSKQRPRVSLPWGGWPSAWPRGVGKIPDHSSIYGGLAEGTKVLKELQVCFWAKLLFKQLTSDFGTALFKPSYDQISSTQQLYLLHLGNRTVLSKSCFAAYLPRWMPNIEGRRTNTNISKFSDGKFAPFRIFCCLRKFAGHCLKEKTQQILGCQISKSEAKQLTIQAEKAWHSNPYHSCLLC